MPVVVAQNDPIIRFAQVLLDPDTPAERQAAIADYYSVDIPDFAGWMEGVRARLPHLFPATMVMVDDADALHAALPDAAAAIVESLEFGAAELAAGPDVRIVQKFGIDARNIDAAACAERGVAVKTLRRRVNVAVAEHAFAMMLAIAKRLCGLNGLIDEASLVQAGYRPKLYDPRHCGKSNWGRVAGLGTLQGATLGAIGMGEIGREVAARARAFDMDVLYYQRNRLPEDIEAPLGATHCSLDELLARSDYVTLQLPHNPSTENLLDRDAFAKIKPGAVVVNVSRAPIINREALIEALDSGRLGGAGLDVHYKEPGDPDDPLLGFDNVLLTPHTAVASRVNGALDMEELVGNIETAIAGAQGG